MNPERLTLSELNGKIKESLSHSFPGQYWVIAEISEINTNTTGHCYLELIEKETTSDRLIARMRATIWSSTFRMLRPYFENATGYRLSAGIKIMVSVNVSFHEIYGLSLNIRDIDPAYTLGDLARKKIEIINRLTSEGVIDMNRQLPFPAVPQRIAVISSETAAGYGDFMNTIQNNMYGFAFRIKMFTAVMQGDKAAESIIAALDRIFEEEYNFDLVVLIRGGGAQADLECFNNYDLAFHITQFPLPILTGIGHERDETIADLVAHFRLKTPTAVAEFLIDRLSGFLELLQSFEGRLSDATREIVSGESERLNHLTRMLSHKVNRLISERKSVLAGMITDARLTTRKYFEKASLRLEQQKRLTYLQARNLTDSGRREITYRYKELIRSTHAFMHHQKERLNRFEQQKQNLDPANIMKRGFSITLHNGTVVKNTDQLRQDDELTTILYSGEIRSNVKQLIKKKKND